MNGFTPTDRVAQTKDGYHLITRRPADSIAPMLPKATEGIDPKLIQDEEDIISFIIYPQPALDYFKWRSLPADQRLKAETPQPKPQTPGPAAAAAPAAPKEEPKKPAAATASAAPPGKTITAPLVEIEET